MASKAVKTPFLRHVSIRRFAAEACPAPVKHAQLCSTKLSNNIFVAAYDNGSPVSRVTIAFKSGSRYEPATEPGLAHVLRSAAGFTTCDASAFAITRNLQQLGASLTATTDREIIYYTLEATQNNLREAVKFLTSVATKQEFRPWELSDNNARLRLDIASLAPQVRAVDLLHRAAYRRGLGNSLFVPPRRIGKVTSESLQHFVATNFTADRCAVSVVGASQERALAIAQSLNLPARSPAEEKASKYTGGELRKEIGGELAHVALAVEGAKAGSNEALALAVAARALGNGPAVKWGGDNSTLAKAIGNVGPFAAAGFNLAYSDSGLFGVLLSVHKDEAEKAVSAVACLLKKASLDEAAVQAAKNSLKVEILDHNENNTGLAEQLAAQGLYSGCVQSPAQIAEAVDKLSASDISKILSTVSKSKLSMGAVGNLAAVPYTDEV